MKYLTVNPGVVRMLGECQLKSRSGGTIGELSRKPQTAFLAMPKPSPGGYMRKRHVCHPIPFSDSQVEYSDVESEMGSDNEGNALISPLVK